jgi:acetylornithine deacetylase
MNQSMRSEIRDVVAGLREKAVSDLAALVRLDSTLGNEIPAQDWIRGRFSDLGLQVEDVSIDLDLLRHRPGFSPAVIENTDGRINVVGVHHPSGSATGRSLILNGHMDVVPTGPQDLWSRSPFDPHVEGDWIYGRGSGDMKAGIVAYCIAFQALQQLGLQPAGQVILQSVIEEECTGNGALACLEAGYHADAAIIPEPMEQCIMYAQLGVMWLQVEVTGKPAHVLDTSAGINAIESVYAIFDGLRSLEKRWNEHLGKISGGEWGSTVPSRCVADIRVGFYPGMELAEVRQELEACISAVAESHPSCSSAKVQIHYRGFQAEGCVMNREAPMMRLLADVHREVAGKDAEFMASTATTDARFFQIYGGIPATCYGPTAENIHGIDERVSIDSMMETSEVLALFILDWCGLERRQP